MMDDEIHTIIARLDSLVPREGAEISFAAYGETAMYGNRLGYLRLGIELMKQAYTGLDDGGKLKYMMAADTDFEIDHFTKDRDSFDFISS